MVFCWIGFMPETGLQLSSLTQKEYISAEADPPASIGGIIVMREWEKTRTGTVHAARERTICPGACAAGHRTCRCRQISYRKGEFINPNNGTNEIFCKLLYQYYSKAIVANYYSSNFKRGRAWTIFIVSRETVTILNNTL